MSFGLPSVKVQPSQIDSFNLAEGPFGVPNTLSHGIPSTKSQLGHSHPLEASLQNFHKNQMTMDLMMLRNTQGLHAPLKIIMELGAVSKVGRLPFLQSSNLLRDSLTGNDLQMGFEDILNNGEFQEQMGQPHAMVEAQLGLL